METQAISIRGFPGSGFHFGQRGIGQAESAPCPASDTLFAAIITRLAALAPEAVEPFVDGFPRWEDGQALDASPPFLLTSAFPSAGEVRFFPKPEHTTRQASEKPPSDSGVRPKDLKKLTFVSETIFRGLLDGDSLGEWSGKRIALQNGRVWLASTERDQLPERWRSLADDVLEQQSVWKTVQRPRVAIDRATDASNIFHSGHTMYAEDCGMWFAIAWRDPKRKIGEWSIEELVDRALDDLALAGLGGLRSIGMGACAIDAAGALSLPDANGGPWVTLSRFHPRPQDMPALMHSAASYQVVTVGGWVHVESRADQRRIPIQMLAEGSVFGSAPSQPAGDVVDVRPRYANPDGDVDHPVWRYGLAFPVGIKVKEGAA